MFQKVLLPLDGSAFAEAARPYAVAMAKAFDGRLTMLGVMDTVATPNGRKNGKVRTTTLRMDYLLRQLRDGGIPSQKGRVHLVQGSPASVIVDYVKRNKYDLVVMATHGRTGVLRVALGSVADWVVRHAPAPVLLVRPPDLAHPSPTQGGAVGAIRHVLVPLDGSSFSSVAMDYAVPIAKAAGADLQLVSAVGTTTAMTDADSRSPQTDVAFVETKTRTALEAASAYLEGIAVLAEVQGVQTETIAVPGSPSDAITRMAQERGDTLVVMTTHGRTGFGRALLGSVTGAVTRASHAPVLVLRPGLPASFVAPASPGSLAGR